MCHPLILSTHVVTVFKPFSTDAHARFTKDRVIRGGGGGGNKWAWGCPPPQGFRNDFFHGGGGGGQNIKFFIM